MTCHDNLNTDLREREKEEGEEKRERGREGDMSTSV